MIDQSISDRDLLKSMTALYVEDEAEIRGEMTVFLQRRLGDVLVAQDGQQGLEVFIEGKPDLVITDLLMPKMDGLALTRAIRERDPDVPIIVMTAHNDEPYLIKSIELKVDRYLFKPLEPERIQEALQETSRRVRQRQELAQAQDFIATILDLHPNLLVVTDARGHIEFANQTFLEFFDQEDLAHFLQGAPNLGEMTHLPETAQKAPERTKEIAWLAQWAENDSEAPIVLLADEKHPILHSPSFALTVRAIPRGGRWIFSFADITAIGNEIHSLRQKAYIDPLTGICNRAQLQIYLKSELSRARRQGTPLSLLLFDIDHFKQVNDRYGHQAGDDVLVTMARLLTPRIRGSDLLARWGGEEFLVVSPGSDLTGGFTLAEKLRQLIEAHPFPAVGQVTISAGVSELNDADSIRSLLERADQALYRAKEQGRNRTEAS